MVRLIDAEKAQTCNANQFQFHDGTIDSMQFLHCLYPLPVFQFHDGTIDRPWPINTGL